MITDWIDPTVAVITHVKEVLWHSMEIIGLHVLVVPGRDHTNYASVPERKHVEILLNVVFGLKG